MALISTLVCLCNSSAVTSSSPRRSHKDSTHEIGRRHPTGVLRVHTGDDHVTSNQSVSRLPSAADDEDDEDYAVSDMTSLSHSRAAGAARRLQSNGQLSEEAGKPHASSSDQDGVRTLGDDHHGDSDSRLRSSRRQPPRWSRSGATRVIVYDRQNQNYGNDEEGSTDAQDVEAIPAKSRNLTVDTWRTRMR